MLYPVLPSLMAFAEDPALVAASCAFCQRQKALSFPLVLNARS